MLVTRWGRRMLHLFSIFSYVNIIFASEIFKNGGLAQLARALAWHARGHRFESDILHLRKVKAPKGAFFIGRL